MSFPTQCARCVELALHDVKLPIDRSQPPFRFNNDQPVHAVGDVRRHMRTRAVIDVHAGTIRQKAEDLCFSILHLREDGSASRSCDRMEINGMRCMTLGRMFVTDFGMCILLPAIRLRSW